MSQLKGDLADSPISLTEVGFDFEVNEVLLVDFQGVRDFLAIFQFADSILKMLGVKEIRKSPENFEDESMRIHGIGNDEIWRRVNGTGRRNEAWMGTL